MADYLAFAEGFLESGAVRLDAAPVLGKGEQARLSALLARCWRWHALQIPGEPLRFDERTACAALDVAAWACWFLVSLNEPPDEVALRLEALREGDPASADLALSRLPFVLRRARLIGSEDALAVGLERLLRRWPLSGVLADISAPPLGRVDFGHEGLRLLYAERLAQQPRLAWAVEGPARPYIELVFGQRGLALPAPLEAAS